MKTAISLPDPLFEAAEELARRLGLSRSGLYAAAIAEYVTSRRETRVTELLNSVYSKEASELDEIWLDAQAETMFEDDW